MIIAKAGPDIMGMKAGAFLGSRGQNEPAEEKEALFLSVVPKMEAMVAGNLSFDRVCDSD